MPASQETPRRRSPWRPFEKELDELGQIRETFFDAAGELFTPDGLFRFEPEETAERFQKLGREFERSASLLEAKATNRAAFVESMLRRHSPRGRELDGKLEAVRTALRTLKWGCTILRPLIAEVVDAVNDERLVDEKLVDDLAGTPFPGSAQDDDVVSDVEPA